MLSCSDAFNPPFNPQNFTLPHFLPFPVLRALRTPNGQGAWRVAGAAPGGSVARLSIHASPVPRGEFMPSWTVHFALFSEHATADVGHVPRRGAFPAVFGRRGVPRGATWWVGTSRRLLERCFSDPLDMDGVPPLTVEHCQVLRSGFHRDHLTLLSRLRHRAVANPCPWNCCHGVQEKPSWQESTCTPATHCLRLTVCDLCFMKCEYIRLCGRFMLFFPMQNWTRQCRNLLSRRREERGSLGLDVARVPRPRHAYQVMLHLSERFSPCEASFQAFQS